MVIAAVLFAGAISSPAALTAESGDATAVAQTNFLKEPIVHPPLLHRFSLAEYRVQAVRRLLDQVNEIAGNLGLPEKLPLTEQSVGAFVSKPDMAAELGMVGTIETLNYSYSFARSNKFCFLTLQHSEEKFHDWLNDYSWPVRLADTNGAYALATQWLGSVSMDVAALNRDCKVGFMLCGLKGHGKRQTFSPVYWVLWLPDPKVRRPIASVQLFAPTKTLIQLRVEDARYILRKPTEIPFSEGQ